MAYKTILTIVTDTRELQQLDAAADMAIREDGHLEVLCLGINPIEAGYFFPAYKRQQGSSEYAGERCHRGCGSRGIRKKHTG